MSSQTTCSRLVQKRNEGHAPSAQMEQFRDPANVGRGEETICYARDNERPCPIFTRAIITKEWRRPQSRQAGDKVDKRPPMAYNEWIVRTSPTPRVSLSAKRLPSAIGTRSPRW